MINLSKLNNFLAESLDKKFLSSATILEGINKTIYRIQSDTTELTLHVKEKEALIQNSNNSETLFHVNSNFIDNVLPRLVSQAISKPKTYKTPFGVYSNVVIAPVERHPYILSHLDMNNGTEYRNVFYLVPSDDKVAIYLNFGEDWKLVGHSENKEDAVYAVNRFFTASEQGPGEVLPGDTSFFKNILPEAMEDYRKNPTLENIPLLESVVFQDSNQNRWIVSQEEARITLGFYDLLVDSTSEYAILLMPGLYPEGAPKISINSRKSSTVREDIVTSYSLMSSPKSVPGIGTLTSSVNIVSSVDKKKIKENSKALLSFYRKRKITSKTRESLDLTYVGKQADLEELESLIEEAEVTPLKGFLEINQFSGFSKEHLAEFYKEVHSNTKKNSINSKKKEESPKSTEKEDPNYMANFFRVDEKNKKRLLDIYTVKKRFDPEDIKMYTDNQQEALNEVKNKIELKEILELGTGLC